MKKAHAFKTLLLCILFFSGCTTIVDSTTKEPIGNDPTKRTFGTYIDDQRLEVISGVNINKAHPDLKRSHINTTSYNGILLLTGQVPTTELRLLAAQTATKIQNVRQVYNELQVNGNTALLTRTSDTWLAAKVKTILIANKTINSSKIKIVVEDGTVYLMGLITRADADYAAEITSNVGGVQAVVRVFEYID